MAVKNVFKRIVAFKTVFLAILCPILLLPLFYSIDGDTGRCAYGIAILVSFWVFEVFPIAVTSLLPVVLFPILGVLSAADVASQYVKTVSLTIIGIFGMVTAVEKSGLHKRIALGILRLFGTKPHWLILGMLVSTAVLSMFITAGVTVLMLPIVRSMMDRLKNVDKVKDLEKGVKVRLDLNSKHVDLDMLREKLLEQNQSGNGIELVESQKNFDDQEVVSGSPEFEASNDGEIGQLYKALSLCIAYGASLGSSSTLTGHPTNFVLVAFADDFYRNYGLNSPLTFVSWLVMALPTIVITLILTWVWFVILFLRGKGLFRRSSTTDTMKKAEKRVQKYIKQEHLKLGPITYPEVMSLVFLLLLVVLFMTEDLYFLPGWDSLFKPGFVGSATTACLLTVLLFFIPAKSPKELFCRKTSVTKGTDERDYRFSALITWEDMESTTPWSIILLLGAAFTIVKSSKVSGLTDLLGTQFDSFVTLEPWLLTLVVTLISTFLTEFISSSATIAMLLPIVGRVALSAGIDPIGLFFPITLAANFAFMMPISTAPNAIAYSLGSLKIRDMATAGFVLNILSLAVVNLAAQTWGEAYFGWDVLPQIMRLNSSSISTNTSIAV